MKGMSSGVAAGWPWAWMRRREMLGVGGVILDPERIPERPTHPGKDWR